MQLSLRIFILLAFTVYVNSASSQSMFSDTLLHNMEWRNIGPFRGGRSNAVAGINGNNLSYYMGSTGGGLWKTVDAGNSWRNISDDYFKTGTVGAIDVSDSDPNVIYVGMGEHAIRGVMTSDGDGMYKSTDAGETWNHIGLPNSKHISDVIIHPRNSDIVYVSVQGALYGPNPERGIYKSINGGSSWEKILFVNDSTGASSLSMDINNPRILYAATWEHQREPWKIKSGGPGSAIYKSTDAGETWVKLTEGLPDKMGKIGICVSPANSKVIYSVIEANVDEAGVYKSTDGGDSWSLVNTSRRNVARSWYYMEIEADPNDENTVYVLNAGMEKSIDGGKTFSHVGGRYHGDTHDLWINPENSDNYIMANDGGGCITYNNSKTWSSQYNQPTVQFYRVNADRQFPYRLYSGQQDNSSVSIASRGPGGISEQNWEPSAGGEAAFLAFDPDNPIMVYGSDIEGLHSRLNTKSNVVYPMSPYPELPLGMVAKDMKYRYNWNNPMIASPHNYDVLYSGSQFLMKSTDQGINWLPISPDLTRNQKERQGITGMPFTNEAGSAEHYNTIMYISESPLNEGTIWVGTDDGLVQLTTDGGKSWKDVTPKNMPEGIVNCIDASSFESGTAYIAMTRYKFEDQTPYLYKTADFGKSWKLITKNLDAQVFTRTIREDNKVKGLLYCGTERDIHVSFDDGNNWQSLKINMPAVPITDLIIADNDLCAATAGRGFWILDDLSPIQQSKLDRDEVVLFTPKNTIWADYGSGGNINSGRGVNPLSGVIIDYYLPQEMNSKELVLKVVDQDGKVIIKYSNQKDKSHRQFEGGPPAPRLIPTHKGYNRFNWDFSRHYLPGVDGIYLMMGYHGAKAYPGTYQISLWRGQDKLAESFAKVLPNPNMTISKTDIAAAKNSVNGIISMIKEITYDINLMRDASNQIKDSNKHISGNKKYEGLSKMGDSIIGDIHNWEKNLITHKQKTFQDILNYECELIANLNYLRNAIEGFDPHLSQGAIDRLGDLNKEWNSHKKDHQNLMVRLDEYNAEYKRLEIPAIVIKKSPK